MRDSLRKQKSQWRALGLAAGSLPLVIGHTAYARINTWIGGTGNWSTATNWSTDAIPSTGDAAQVYGINNNMPQTINYDYAGPAVSLGDIGIDGGSNFATLSMAANTLTVTDAEEFGEIGNGAMNQSGGANNTNSLYLGNIGGSNGSYTLSGSGFISVNFIEYIGNSGQGTFVQTGGTHTVQAGLGGVFVLGQGTGAAGTYNLSGGDLSVSIESGGEIVGYVGRGTFDQTGGTHTVSGSIILGDFSPGLGTYSLSGNGSLSVSAYEEIGGGGTGYFYQSGGSNSVTNLFVGGNRSSYYALSGGYLSVANNENIDTSGIFSQTSGTNSGNALVISQQGTYALAGGTLSFGQLDVSGGSLSIANDAAGFGSILNGAKIALAGQVGTSLAGDLTVTSGGYTQLSEGELDIGVGGDLPNSQFGTMAVVGMAALGGTLNVSLTNDFVPSAGETFDIITAGSIDGTFSTVNLPAGMVFSITYTPNDVVLTALPEPTSLGLPGLVVVSLISGRRFRNKGSF
jgi:hypothetical protein